MLMVRSVPGKNKSGKGGCGMREGTMAVLGGE